MAKKRQTTGMPKKENVIRRTEEVENPSYLDKLLGNPTTRADREQALNQLIQRSVLIIAAAITLIVGIALAYEFLVVPNFAVASVNGQNITVSEFRERYNLERALAVQQANIRYSQLQQQAAAFGMDVNQLVQQDQVLQQYQLELQFPDALGQRVLNDMIDDLLIAQEADAQGISVNEEAVQGAVNDFFGYDATQVALVGTPATETPIPTETPTPFVSPTPTNTPMPTVAPTENPEATEAVEVTEEATVAILATIPPSPTPSQQDRIDNFAETVDLFRTSLVEGDVAGAAIDGFFQRQALRDAVTVSLFGEGETAVYVNVRHILVETEEEANTIVAALNNGESFAELARALSTDTGSGSRGGELGWNPVAQYVPEFAAAAGSAEIGTITGPVESQFGFHILQVRGREDREVSGSEQGQILAAQFSQWLTDRREAAEAANEITTNNDWPSYLP